MRKASGITLTVITAMVIALPLSFDFAQAQAPANDTAALQKLVSELQTQIKLFQAQISELQTKIQSQERELVAVKLELQFTKTLQKGASGEEVKKLQELLKNYPDIYPQGLVTGYFGLLTETAVKKLQEKTGLESLGVVGPKTRDLLNQIAVSPPSSAPSGTIPAIPAKPAEPAPGAGTPAIPAIPATPAIPEKKIPSPPPPPPPPPSPSPLPSPTPPLLPPPPPPVPLLTPPPPPPPPPPPTTTTTTITTTAPASPYDLKIVNGYSPSTEPPKMFAQLFFKYALQSDSKYINVYFKKPTDNQFIKYTHDAQLTVKNSYTQVGESYMSYTPSTQAWVWDLTPWKSSADWPVGTYQYYITSVNTSGVESSPSPQLSFSVTAPPIINYPTGNQTVSLPLTISVKDPTGLTCANAHAALYKAGGATPLWEKVICSTAAYDGPTLSTDGNPYRLVVYGPGLGGVSMSQASVQYFNVPSTTSSEKPDLTIQDIYIESNTNYLSLKLSNIGTAAAPDTGHLYIWIDDVLKWTYSFSTLASTQRAFLSPGGVTVVQPQALTGEHRIKATIDPNNLIAESNETNNTLEKTVNSMAPTTSVSPTPTTQSPVTVVSPNGGECLAGIFPITWSSSLSTDVRFWDLGYSTDNSWYWYVQWLHSPSYRSYKWATQDRFAGTQGKIRVRACGQTFPQCTDLGFDISDDVFNLNASCPGGTIPAAPTNLVASPKTYPTGAQAINLKWTDNSDNELGFATYKRVKGASQWDGPPLAVEGTAIEYQGIQAGTIYEFKVRSGNQYGYSADSEITTAAANSATTTAVIIPDSGNTSNLALSLESLNLESLNLESLNLDSLTKLIESLNKLIDSLSKLLDKIF